MAIVIRVDMEQVHSYEKNKDSQEVENAPVSRLSCYQLYIMHLPLDCGTLKVLFPIQHAGILVENRCLCLCIHFMFRHSHFTTEISV